MIPFEPILGWSAGEERFQKFLPEKKNKKESDASCSFALSIKYPSPFFFKVPSSFSDNGFPFF